jgi:GTP-binding protein
MSFTVAIVGRPNVGKSTLFNRLVGKRLALVDDQPGVTRDRREGQARLYDLDFRVIDTAGLEDAADDSLEARMRQQTELAIAEADLVLFLIDARAGATPLDAHFADLLRRASGKTLLVANKCEGRAADPGLLDAYSLGLGEPLALSAEHGLGLADLHEVLKPYVPRGEEEAVDLAASLAEIEAQDEEFEEAEAERDYGPLQMAVVGRPNVGKSTLINRLLGEDRLLTGPEAGITRDSIALDWDFGGRPVRLVDTAGLRKRARVTDKVERLSAADTKRAIDYANVAVLLLDGAVEANVSPLERQDLTIAASVIEEGRALVIAVNKWDACEDRIGAMRLLRDRLERSLPQTKGVPIVPISALEGRGLDKLMEAVFGAYEVWNVRLPTGQLNRWLEAATTQHPPPAPHGKRIRLKYVTQAKTRPPTFVVFCSMPKELPDSYLRYLENSLRTDFDLPGTPIRIFARAGENPYAKPSRRRRKKA